ncbi:MAG: AAA family ATPase [Flavobacteriales bacterium]|nr:AAA family ATPase [Flavobacteriales bacterium]MCB9197818.1 AAA family ATPase [Flavobacteriales bacterium]
MAKEAKHRFKVKSLRMYYSLESLYGGNRKFRSVFVDKEVDYLRAELALYNILFDEEDWETKVVYKCFKKGSSTEMFTIEHDLKATKDQNILNVRRGWGNENKTFWTYGSYDWKAYIDGEMVAETTFHIAKEGLVTRENNPYFDISAVKLYQSSDTVPKLGERTYLTQFKNEEAHYIHAELTLMNKLTYNWWCEIEFNFYTENNQHKGYVSELKEFKGNSLIMSPGWGSVSESAWLPGNYTCELLFMGQLIAIIPFSIGSEAVEGSPKILGPDKSQLEFGATGEMEEEKLEELIDDLNKLIGLTTIKEQVTEYIDYLKFEKIREEKGLKHNKNIKLHSVFTGNPGTGKTTVAKKMGKIYKAMGLLSAGHVHEVDRADLVGEYIGQTAPKVKEAIEKARGGVLFIDEAYSLARENESSKDYGKEVIEILLKEMSDGPGNVAIFVAGYPKEMNVFINSNPGLKSRFTNYYHFPDYLPEELMEIARSSMDDKGLIVEQDAWDYFEQKVIRAYRDRDGSFGNARYVLSLVDGAKMNMALRLVKKRNMENMNDDELSTVTIADVQEIFVTGNSKKLHLTVDEPRLKDALNELDALVGMENIKQEIRDTVKLVRYYNDIGKDVMHKFVMHSVFEGNPGTGKTTVARIFAKIFNALGILEKGHLVECDRSSLVAEYTGQTAPKTLAKVEEAIGGVLFIDEAYALVDGPHDSLGRESISTILKQMEDRNTEFILIAAGYPKNMEVFLRANPGLKSRFNETITFHDYSAEELFRIAEFMFFNEELSMDENAADIIRDRLEIMYKNRDEFFGNAREVRKLVQEITQLHHLRMADLPKDERTVKMITTVTPDDLEGLKPLEYNGKSRLGFITGKSV